MTVVLDDDLIEKAMSYTGLRKKSVLIREALVALVEREALDDLQGLVAANLIWSRFPSGGVQLSSLVQVWRR
jgi:Arc/MetJ family transcription regulator